MSNAFNGSAAIKERCLALVRTDGAVINSTRGALCAIVDGASFGSFETELGIPQALAKLVDEIFFTLTPKDGQKWLEGLLVAMPVGADLDAIWPAFSVHLCEDSLQHATNQEQQEALSQILPLFRQEPDELETWLNAVGEVLAAFEYSRPPTKASEEAARLAGSAVVAAFDHRSDEACMHMLQAASCCFNGKEATNVRLLTAAKYGDVVLELVQSAPVNDASASGDDGTAAVTGPTFGSTICAPRPAEDEEDEEEDPWSDPLHDALARESREARAALINAYGLRDQDLSWDEIEEYEDELKRLRLAKARHMPSNSTMDEINRHDRCALACELGVRVGPEGPPSWDELDAIFEDQISHAS